MPADGKQPERGRVCPHHPHFTSGAGRPPLERNRERSVRPDLDGVIILLSAPNDDAGRLSSVAQERCRQALAEYRAAPGWAILPTGGFGAHFNRSPEPHAHLTRRWLLAHGVPEQDVLEPVLSRFTSEDAALSKPVVERCGVRHLKVVTSDFHVARAEMIFKAAFSGYQLVFSGSTTRLPRYELERLLEHEQTALARLGNDDL